MNVSLKPVKPWCLKVNDFTSWTSKVWAVRCPGMFYPEIIIIATSNDLVSGWTTSRWTI
jgi:hypothetical protein